MGCSRCDRECSDHAEFCIECRALFPAESGTSPSKEIGGTKIIHFITCFSRKEAESGRSFLESQGIKAIVSVDEMSGVRLWIHKEDSQKAVKVFQERTVGIKNPILKFP